MKISITLHDYLAEYFPFKFRGFWEEGSCFLRVISKNGRVVFFCCQLPEYYGTSITNAVESIWDGAVEELLRAKTDDGKPVLDFSANLSIFEKLFQSKRIIEEKSRQDIKAYVRKNSIWIEHYPPDLGIAVNGSYAIVHFSDSGEPTWNYVSKNYLQNQIPGVNLNVSVEELRQWK